MSFHWKKALSVFEYFNYLSSCQKSENLMSHSSEKCQTDGRTDGQSTVILLAPLQEGPKNISNIFLLVFKIFLKFLNPLMYL